MYPMNGLSAWNLISAMSPTRPFDFSAIEPESFHLDEDTALVSAPLVPHIT
jgi:hypothetical protein